MQRDADGRLLDFLQQLLHEVTNLLSESSVVKSNYSSPWSTSQKSNKNLSKIFKNVRRHSKEWKGVSIIYLASSIINYVGQGNRCQETNAKMFRRRNVSPLSREVVAGITESSLVPVQSGSLLSWQSGTINEKIIMIIIHREQILHSMGLQACCSSLYENSKRLCFPFFCTAVCLPTLEETWQLSGHIVPWPRLAAVTATWRKCPQCSQTAARWWWWWGGSPCPLQSSAQFSVLHPLVIIMLPGFVTFFINN